jgi:hypothetical protein
LFKRVLKSVVIGSASYYPNMLLPIDWDEDCANVAKLLPINCPDTADVLFLSGERW